MLKPHPITNEKFGVSIMIASGPFTTNQNLSYFPLNSLLKHVNRLQPDILLLVHFLYNDKYNNNNIINNNNNNDINDNVNNLFIYKVLNVIFKFQNLLIMRIEWTFRRRKTPRNY